MKYVNQRSLYRGRAVCHLRVDHVNHQSDLFPIIGILSVVEVKIGVQWGIMGWFP